MKRILLLAFMLVCLAIPALAAKEYLEEADAATSTPYKVHYFTIGMSPVEFQAGHSQLIKNTNWSFKDSPANRIYERQLGPVQEQFLIMHKTDGSIHAIGVDFTMTSPAIADSIFDRAAMNITKLFGQPGMNRSQNMDRYMMWRIPRDKRFVQLSEGKDLKGQYTVRIRRGIMSDK